MENVVDAIYMSSAVLLFLIALSVAVLSFNNTREGVDQFFKQNEAIDLAKNGTEYLNYIQSRDEGAIRIVGAETLISSMNRALKERYTIYIKLKDYTRISNEINRYDVTSDKKNTNGENIVSIDDKVIKIAIGNDSNQEINRILGNEGLYKIIKDKNFFEYLGEYQEENEVSAENKDIYRIITYVEI